MGKAIADVMSYEDDRDFPELLEGKSVKKTLKGARKTKRNERKVGDMSFSGLIWYAFFWKLFVPHYAVIVTLALTAETALVVVKLVK
jgi:hypothetical protein